MERENIKKRELQKGKKDKKWVTMKKKDTTRSENKGKRENVRLREEKSGKRKKEKKI